LNRLLSLIKNRKRLIVSAAVIIGMSLPSAGLASAYDHMTYLYGGLTSTYLSRMGKTNDSVNIVSPDYLEVSDAGDIIYTKQPDPELLAVMRNKNIKVLPFLSNHFKRDQARAMLAKTDAAVTKLAAVVEEYELDGLDIDIQNINEKDRTDFTAFIAKLRGALPDNRELTVCVAANPWGINVGWQGGYDYEALAKHCNHVFMMTYDESYETSAPGPVSSMKFIEDSIKYGLKKVPKEKLMMGIPFYGRYWPQTNTAKAGYAWTCADIEWLARDYGTRVWYDSENECARATIVIPEGSNVKTWGGTKIPPDTYDVWYENESSYEAKLALVRKYGLKGVGTWALGQEPSYMWDNFSAWLNGLIFADIKDHWSQSYVISLAEKGLLNGRTENLFEPEGRLTRAEAAAMLCRINGIQEEIGLDADAVTVFSDTGSHWACGWIAAAKKAGLISGYPDGTFMPDSRVTREEFTVMAERGVNVEDAVNLTDSPYSDVSKHLTPWSNDAILILSSYSVISGYSDGSFRPRENVKRGEAAKIVSLVRELPTRFLDGYTLLSDEEKAHMEPR